MSEATTLIDQLYAQTFGKKVPAWRSHKLMRQALTRARRFVLNPDMASFLANITCAACDKRTRDLNFTAIHQMRAAARLPHEITWVEYDLLEYMKREDELITAPSFALPDGISHVQEGWLLNNFDQDNQEFRMQLFHRLITVDGAVEFRTFPFAPCWRTDNDKPHSEYKFRPNENNDDIDMLGVVLGGRGGGCRQVTVGPSELLTPLTTGIPIRLNEHGIATGVVRRLWAFLATINDIPVLTKTVRAAKGFTAKAQYHRFLEHKIISLHVPQEIDHRELARSIVAIAKRRAHMVRGHWRKDWRRPLAVLCEHEFKTVEGALQCERCQGRQLFVHEHQRGDASIGFVTHDYRVVH